MKPGISTILSGFLAGMILSGCRGESLSPPDPTPSPASTAAASSTPALPSTPRPTLTGTASPAPAIGSTRRRAVDGMILVYVPSGEFNMGTMNAGGCPSEYPEHRVFLDAFWLDRTEVTNFMYSLCVHSDACQPPRRTDSSTRPSYFNNPRYAEYPVINVEWNQADTYCRWAGARLPTEAEWEKAARGTDDRIFPWGNAEPSCLLANDVGCVGDTSAVDAHPSGVSPYGALDMAGNVWEWVADWHGYYSPAFQSNPRGPAVGVLRIVRGSSWNGDGSYYNSFMRL